MKDLCRKHGFSDASFYLWRAKDGGMDVSDAKRLKGLKADSGRLKRLLADAMLENEVTKEGKKMVSAPARRELVRWMGTRGLCERRCLAVAGMSVSSFRYQPRPDENAALRARIVALSQRHRRYGSTMRGQCPQGQVAHRGRPLPMWLGNSNVVISLGITTRVLRGLLVDCDAPNVDGVTIARDAPQGAVLKIIG